MIDSRTDESFSNRYTTQFYKLNDVPSYNTYRLTITATSGADQLQIGELQLLNLKPEEIEDPTGINVPLAPELCEEESRMKNEELTDRTVYDLSGRRISTEANTSLKQGIYIQDGKKLLINK